MKKGATKPHADRARLVVRSPRMEKAERKTHPLVQSSSPATNGLASRRTVHEVATRPSGPRARGSKPQRTTPHVLEERVAALERELRQMKALLATAQPSAALPWWERLTGSFATDPLFEEMVAAGQAYRRAQNARSRA